MTVQLKLLFTFSGITDKLPCAAKTWMELPEDVVTAPLVCFFKKQTA